MNNTRPSALSRLLLAGCAFLSCGCAGSPPASSSAAHNKAVQDSAPPVAVQPCPRFAQPAGSYHAAKAGIAQIRASAQQGKIGIDSASRLFTQLLLQRIIPYWYGTRWSFEGHTATPKKGEIACGYFVSTSLNDAGLRINKYKLAQQLPIDEARIIAGAMPVLEIQEASPLLCIKAMRAQLKDGLYFFGFAQSHVGYLYKHGSSLCLIHSNYLDAQGPCIENIEESAVFAYFTQFYIADISNNPALIASWLAGREISTSIKP